MRCRTLICPDISNGCKKDIKDVAAKSEKFHISDVAGQSGISIPLNISIKGMKLSRKSVILFRGIPQNVALNSGVYRESLWSVPYGKISKLSIIIPKRDKGKFDAEVFLFKNRQSAPERVIFSVKIK